MAEPSSSSSDSDSDDGKISPKKVHFSEIDQVTFLSKSSTFNLISKVKLMSQESLASMAASEGSETTICTSLPPSIQCPALARLVTNNMMASKQVELERALGNDKVASPHYL